MTMLAPTMKKIAPADWSTASSVKRPTPRSMVAVKSKSRLKST